MAVILELNEENGDVLGFTSIWLNNEKIDRQLSELLILIYLVYLLHGMKGAADGPA